MNWIAVEELLLIHARVIDETGGVHGVINSGALHSAIHQPFSAFGGQAFFPSPLDKAAALIHAIIAFHPVVDGNKRAALIAGDVVLRLNGLRIIPSEAVEPYFWAIARGEQDERKIAEWLAAKTEPHGPSGEAP